MNYSNYLLNLRSIAVAGLLFFAVLLLSAQLAQGQSTVGHEPTSSSTIVPSGKAAMTDLYVPLVMAGRVIDSTANKPLPPESYPSDQNAPPVLATDPNATACASFIDFTNFSDESVYIFWVGANNEEFLYKMLDSGRHYWQHTFRLNEWRIRDDAARLLRTVVIEDCSNRAESIFIDDLPPCGGILNIGLHSLSTDEAIATYGTLEDGMTIDLGQLPPAVIHIAAQDAVESIEVIGGGAVIALNEVPYHFPANGNRWSPRTGLTTLVFSAYRKDDAAGKVCDTIELTLLVFNDAAPTVTPSPVITTTGTPVSTPTPTSTMTKVSPSPSPVALPTGTPTATFTATAINTATPTVTPTATTTVPTCQGAITGVRLYDLTTQRPIVGYDPLRSDTVIALDTMPAAFNLDTSVSGGVRSVLYLVNGIASLENAAPYRYPGGDINPWQPTPGAYTIRVNAYELADATGTICDTTTITVNVVHTLATATPTPTPTPTATSLPTATVTPPSATTCIGDQTWRDSNENGIYDPGEPALAAIDLYLWADDNRDGAADRIVGTTTSTIDGIYAFCELESTITYIVEFGTNPQCRFTVRDQGVNDAIDSDANESSGLTAPVQLINGQTNNTIDAGYVCALPD